MAEVQPRLNRIEIQPEVAAGVAGEVRGSADNQHLAGPSAPPSVRANGLRPAALERAHFANQISVSTPEQPSLMPIRDASGAQAASNSNRDGGYETGSSKPGGVTTSSAATGIAETFASLDGESSTVAPTWIRAGARAAEAGYQDPALGWVGVRAQVDGNGVHAFLVPGSADAAQTLGGHMAGLNAYLTEHHTAVNTLTMAAPETHWDGQGMEQGGGHGAGQETGYSDQSSGSNREPIAVQTADRSTAASPVARPDAPEAGMPSGGVYISVMA